MLFIPRTMVFIPRTIVAIAGERHPMLGAKTPRFQAEGLVVSSRGLRRLAAPPEKSPYGPQAEGLLVRPPKTQDDSGFDAMTCAARKCHDVPS